jgi:hypothetical protein
LSKHSIYQTRRIPGVLAGVESLAAQQLLLEAGEECSRHGGIRLASAEHPFLADSQGVILTHIEVDPRSAYAPLVSWWIPTDPLQQTGVLDAAPAWRPTQPGVGAMPGNADRLHSRETGNWSSLRGDEPKPTRC